MRKPNSLLTDVFAYNPRIEHHWSCRKRYIWKLMAYARQIGDGAMFCHYAAIWEALPGPHT